MLRTDEGDDGGFTAYFEPRAGELLRFAYLLTGDAGEAEDLTQTTLTSVFVVWPRVRGHDRPDAYARRVMVNANTRRFRRRVRQVLVDMPPERAEPSPQLAAVEDRAGLATALAALPPRQRAVVVLRYCEDLPEAEVAALLRCSAGTVKSQAAKGLAKLRTHPAITGPAAAPAVPTEVPAAAGAPPLHLRYVDTPRLLTLTDAQRDEVDAHCAPEAPRLFVAVADRWGLQVLLAGDDGEGMWPDLQRSCGRPRPHRHQRPDPLARRSP